jgi:PKD repeat protein
VLLDTDNAAGQGAANQANDRASTPFTVVAPDLFLKSFSVDPSGAAGSKVNFNLSIVNQGTGSAAFSTAEMRLSASSLAPSSSDPLLLSLSLGDLAPGSTYNSSGTTFPIPANTNPGAYYIWMTLDVTNSAGQVDHANDRTKVPFTVTGTPGPDLIPQSFTVSPSGNPGSNASYSVSIHNKGTSRAESSTTEFRLSDSSVAPSGGDPLLLSLSTPAIDAGGTTSLSGSNLPIPANAILGTKYIWVTLDATGSAGQGATNQANDRAKATFTVTGALLPDLVTQSLSVNPGSGTAGSGVSILYTIANQGTATANPSHAEIRLSTSSLAPSSSDPLLYSFQTDSIPANGFNHYGTTLSLPTDTSLGTKYMWVLLDTDNAAGQGAANQANDRTGTPFTVVALAAPVASFTWSPQSPSAGQPVQFTDTSTGSPTSWSWNFGDGTIGPEKFVQNPAHTYPYSGPYYLSLIATNASGSSTSNTFTVNVGNAPLPRPVASFRWSPQSPSAGQPVQFTDTSTGSPTSWSWNFGDGTIGPEKLVQNPAHTYPYSGPYYVSLIATNASGSNTSSTFTVNVGNASTLSITTASLNPPTATVGVGYAAQQAVTATGGQMPYTWSEAGVPNGMAINSTSGAVFGTPTVAGTFNFTVTVQDSSSPRQTASRVLALFCGSAQPTCALNCSADVPASGIIGSPLSFVAGSSSSTCIGPVSQSWTFGDGKTGSGASVTHAYGTAGVFNWTLTTSQGDSTCVRNGSVSIGTAASGLPTIDYFRASHDQIAVGGTSDLTWSVRNASTVTIDGLGSVAASSGATVAPTTTTTYKLTATNSAGAQTATLTVRVDSTLSVSIHADRITGTTPLAVTFTALVSGGVPPYRYQWSFGDTWTTPTSEDVTCSVTDAHGSIQKSNPLRIIASATSAGIQLQFLDQKSNTLPTDPYRRIGASADGVTTVEVRATTTASGNVTFKFDGRVGRELDGGLFPTLDAVGPGASPLTVHNKPSGAQFVASVYYQVPEDFNGATDDQFQRIFHFSAHLGDDGATADIDNVEFHLRRTPVLFVHGIWSSISSWDDFPLATQLVAQGDATLAAWDGLSSISSGADQVRPYFDLALHVLRRQGIAVSRVDVVAHSMGGLIARQLAARDTAIVHKLITIDTPHYGSALADWVVANKANFFIAGYFIPSGHPIDTGALDDLRLTASGTLARAAHTNGLRAHAIVGVASTDEHCNETDINQLPRLVSYLCLADEPLDLANCKRTFLTRILNNRPNDEIVDIDSQRGGLSATSQFDSGTLTGSHVCVAAHVNITADFSGDVSRRIKALLNQSATAGPFSAYSLVPVQFASRATSTEGTSAPAVTLLRSRPAATEAIAIVTPLDGQVVTPGSSIEVEIQASPAFTTAFVTTPDQITTISSQPLRTRIDIPATSIGHYAIGARADTVAGDSAYASITLNVTPNASIASLIVQPLEIFLNVGDTVKPFVRGVFTDGVTRDLSRSTAVAFGSIDPSVVTVLGDGTLKAVGFGTARVTVFSGPASAEILFHVESVPRRRAARH